MAAEETKTRVPTKADIQSELDETKERLQRMEMDLRKEQARTIDLASQDAGWLVTCPNELYSGTKFGSIGFLYGQCFIRKNQMVDYFIDEITPMSKGRLHKFMNEQMPIPPHTQKDHDKYEKELRARESNPEYNTAFKAVVHLFADFGYQVEEFLPEQIDKLRARMDKRANEARGISEEVMKGREQAERIIKPGFFGDSQPVSGG